MNFKNRVFCLVLTGLEHWVSLLCQIRVVVAVVAIFLFPRNSCHLPMTTDPMINFACESHGEFRTCTIENWMVVSRGYFSHDSSHSKNIASACRVRKLLPREAMQVDQIWKYKWAFWKKQLRESKDNFCKVFVTFKPILHVLKWPICIQQPVVRSVQKKLPINQCWWRTTIKQPPLPVKWSMSSLAIYAPSQKVILYCFIPLLSGQ